MKTLKLIPVLGKPSKLDLWRHFTFREIRIVDTDKKLFEKQAKLIEDFKENIQMKAEAESPETDIFIIKAKMVFNYALCQNTFDSSQL